MNGNARGKPDLKLRDGPALKKMRGAPEMKIKDVAFCTGIGLENQYLKKEKLYVLQVVKIWVKSLKLAAYQDSVCCINR